MERFVVRVTQGRRGRDARSDWLLHPGSKDLELVIGERVDVELEVYANTFVEVVIQADKSDFDGDLQILQTTQLSQQIGNLLVDFLRLRDHEAQVGGKFF